jgi:SAM-dependent methyltransferase
MSEWWAEEFGPDYAAFLEAITDPERTEAEARACIEVLGLKEGDRVLDLGCGFGRHTKIFARNRMRAVGVDYSPAMLERAVELSGAELTPHYVRASMHRLPFKESFDAVVSLYTSFGYFEDPAENRRTLLEAFVALKEGGRFLLDTASAIPKYAEPEMNTWAEAGSVTVCELSSFDLQTGRNRARIKWWRDGKWHSFFHEEYLYTPPHLAELVEEVGFAVKGVYADLQLTPLSPRSTRNVVLAEKP